MGLSQTKVVFFATAGAGTYTIPSDFQSFVSVEAIGGGGGSLRSDTNGGAGGSGGGAYSRSTTMTGLSPGTLVYYNVGSGGTTGTTAGNGGDSWFSLTNSAPAASSSGANGVLAKGGTAAVDGGTGGAGGVSTSGTGDVRNSGGNGANIGTGSPPGRGGGGGAAGPGGNGGNGGNSATNGFGGGGGGGASLNAAGNNGSGNNGGSSADGVGGTGGAGAAGSGNGTSGGAGRYWIQTSNGNTAGSGGGGGGSSAAAAANGGAGALYGGGAGGSVLNGSIGASGARGIIVFTYVTTGGSGFKKSDDVFGTIDLDDQYITDSWLVDQFVGGTMFSWGIGTGGALGLGNQAYYSSPIQVGSLTNWNYVSASSSGATNYSMSIKTDGTLWTWGNNSQGQLGLGNIVNYSSPVQVGALTNWKQVSTGIVYCLAVKTDGTLWSWGSNSTGQLGNGNRTSYSSPIQVGSLTNWKQVSANRGSPAVEQSCAAVKLDGTLWVWGSNKNGTLGTAGVNNYYSSPIQVGSLTNWKQVSTSFNPNTLSSGWMASVKTDGTLWTWGYNAFGQLGNGNRTYYSSPIQVGTLNNWKYVAAGGDHCLAIKTDGTLWAWGRNTQGQLGVGNTTNYSSPIQVGSLTNWKQVSTDIDVMASTLAVKTDGTLWAWGANRIGQLGQNFSAATSYYSSPIQVGSLTNWKYVSFGGNHALGITFTDLN